MSNCVLTGYYTAYYNNNKHAKKPAEIIKQMLSRPEKKRKKRKEAVDMEAKIAEFQAREAAFKERGYFVNG